MIQAIAGSVTSDVTPPLDWIKNMAYAVSYVLALVVFAAIDITWLVTMGAKLYRQTLGDMLLTDLRMWARGGLLLDVSGRVSDLCRGAGSQSGSPTTALLYGGLFGLFTYGTYELTNYATIRNWTLQITLIDIAYGVIASAIAAAIVAMLAPTVAGVFGAR